MKTKGQHITADIWLNEYSINNSEILSLCEKAINDSGMSIVGFKEHEFGAGAVTAAWLLAESHFSLHTFPERCYLSVDIYTCGKGQPIKAISSLISSLDVKYSDIRIIQRGVLGG